MWTDRIGWVLGSWWRYPMSRRPVVKQRWTLDSTSIGLHSRKSFFLETMHSMVCLSPAKRSCDWLLLIWLVRQNFRLSFLLSIFFIHFWIMLIQLSFFLTIQYHFLAVVAWAEPWRASVSLSGHVVGVSSLVILGSFFCWWQKFLVSAICISSFFCFLCNTNLEWRSW